MAKRPRRFKKASITFPIDLYTKVAAAVEAAPPASLSSWVGEACRAASNPTPDLREALKRARQSLVEAGGTLYQIGMEYCHLGQPADWCLEENGRVHAAIEAIDAVIGEGRNPAPQAASVIEKLPAEAADRLQVGTGFFEDFPELKCKVEFGPQVLAAAARSVPGWSKWDWKQRLEHLRELKAAAVSG